MFTHVYLEYSHFYIIHFAFVLYFRSKVANVTWLIIVKQRFSLIFVILLFYV